MNCNLTNDIIYKEEITTEIIHNTLTKVNIIIAESFNLKVEGLSIDFNSKTLRQATAKNALVFNLFVKEIIKNQSLGIEFIKDAFNINILEDKKNETSDIARDFHIKYNLSFPYAEIYSRYYAQGLSLFLLHLHFEKIIHLPFIFKIPINRNIDSKAGIRKRVDLGINSYPLMLKQTRLLDSNNNSDEESSFLSEDSKANIISYGSRLLLALGWIDFADVNLEEILYFKDNFMKKSGVTSLEKHPPYAVLISFLHKKNPIDFKLNIDQWKKITLKESVRKNEARHISSLLGKGKKIKDVGARNIKKSSINDYFNDNDILNSYWKVSTKFFYLKHLESISSFLPNYSVTINNWTILENSYLNKRRVESYKTIEVALGYWNMYLFFILPIWYQKNNSSILYPLEPKDIKPGFFISNLIADDKIKPPTFLEFMDGIQEGKGMKNESIYSILKNLEKFFDFIETYSEELPGCLGFIQPISSLDFPKVSKSKGTNKGLIPRHIFNNLINYIECIKKYNEVFNQKLLEEKLSSKRIDEIYKKNWLNTIELQKEIGFIPIVYVNNNMVVLKEIPNLLDLKSTSLKDNRIIKINYPHVLNHILVILQTGIRSNHIQWLDAEKFDCMVKDEDSSFVSLYVNTDKAKTNAWTPIVHKHVIDILREQLEWRNNVNNAEFNQKKFYNNNKQTKWGQFYPLFSYTTEGLPYQDNNYSDAWIKILVAFQQFLKSTNLKYIELAKLLPPGIKFNEFNLDIKLKEYGEKCKDLDVCELRWTSDITPHSARVSVVSNYITALPADLIGQYITGQTEAVVHHYVKLDPNYLNEIEKGQTEGLAKLAIKKEFDQLMGKEANHPILTDKENSHIARSIAINKEETIAKYGCISLNLKEDTKSGIDMLIEDSNIRLAFNKTEICPYNNNCPSDLIKELKGLRRCGVCPYAVRSIDHLPAIAVKKRQMMELLQEIENKLAEASLNADKYTAEELDGIEEERQRITEELLGWIVSEEMLEANRKKLQEESNSIQYIVKKPEILIQNLQQVSTKESDVEYLLTRLNDCESFPNLDTPMVRAKFDLLRRQLLARLGDFQKAFDMKLPQNPAQECLGVLKEVINRYQLTQKQTVDLLSTNMLLLGNENKPLLELSYGN